MPTLTTNNTPRSRPAALGLVDITNEEFNAFRELIYEVAGINLSPAKRALVSSRLAKRLRQLGFKTYAEYYAFLLSDEAGDERQQMINCITTNKTEFFREPHHFDFIRDAAIPQIRELARRSGRKRLRIWSAGCSTGEEPYTIAITLLEHFGPLAGWDVKILASDIDTDVLRKAEAGVYPLENIEMMPEALRRRYFHRGTGAYAGSCRVRPELQQLIRFRRINLMEAWPIQTSFDLIFCRNVLIYFNRETQERLVNRFAGLLASDGYLFLGHSENVSWLSNVLQPLGGTIHRLRHDAGRLKSSVRASVTSPSAASRLPLGDSRAPVPVPKHEAAAPPPPAQLPRRSMIVGDVVAAGEPVEFSTVLGSCVAVCLFDPEAGVGGMNHFTLPAADDCLNVSTRYGEQAMRALIKKIIAAGGSRDRLRAKLFGGANLFDLGTSMPEVGRENTRFVRQFLASARIPIDAERLGGRDAVRIVFQPHTGKVIREVLDRPALMAIASDEQAHRAAIGGRPDGAND